MVDPAALREALASAENSKPGSVVGWWLEQQGKPLLAAARELLRLMETAETIKWCEEHKASASDTARECLREGYGDCRMVEAVLTRRDS